jgi:tRNA A-37 threonylcarbamoyl transferase component Bud32
MGSLPNLPGKGARIADRYVIEERLGEGGMGVVFRARDERLGRAVAVKVLLASSVGDAAARARLVREARAAAGLEHPGIVHVYDVGETADGGAFLVMELVRGKSLRDRIAEGGLTVAEASRVVLDVARALSFAHTAGFVHRDVKPDNVMVRDDGRAVILDFGLAKSFTASALAQTIDAGALTLTAKGAMVGTPAYLAPEQAQGEAADARVDQFALAVMAYEVFTGRLPWQGQTAAAVVASLMRDDPEPVQSSRPDLPPELDAVLRRALQKRPEGRFADVEAFAARLASATGTTVSPRGSRRMLWMGGAGIAAAVLFFGAGSLRNASPVGTSSTPDAEASSRASPLGEKDARLACPPLDASGVDEPKGWLGGAAAALACTRAQVMLRGHATRTLVPAELLDVPGEPREDSPGDPFSDPRARERALDAAKKRAAAYFDGSVARTSSEFQVTLVLRDPKGLELATGAGRGSVLYQAVRAAMDALPASALPPVDSSDRLLSEWMGVRSVESALALADLNIALLTEDAVAGATECTRMGKRTDLALDVAYYVKWVCADRLFQPPPAPPTFDLDRSSAGAMARSSHAWRVAQRTTKATIAELVAMTSKAEGPEERALLASAEAEARNGMRDLDGARHAALAAVLASPNATDVFANAWHRLALMSQEDVATRGAHVAWMPYEPFAEAYGAIERSTEGRLQGARRAYLMGPHGFWPSHLGSLLLDAGHREEARSVAVQSGVDALPLEISNSEATFGATLRRSRDLFQKLPQDLEGSYRAFMAAPAAVSAALVLERPFLEADDLVVRYIDHEPPLVTTKIVPMEGAVLVCLVASEKTTRPCIARMRELFDRGSFGSAVGGASAVFEGAEAFARRDYAAAAKAWRTLLRESSWAIEPIYDVVAIAFEKAGEDELAEKLDATLGARGSKNGVDLSFVRSARRAEKRGDKAHARELAQRIVDAWSVADETVPAVAEMRALLARQR